MWLEAFASGPSHVKRRCRPTPGLPPAGGGYASITLHVQDVRIGCQQEGVCDEQRHRGGHRHDTGAVTGTKDKDYNILWFTEACLSNVLRLETYIQDAERDGDSELADFFRRAQSDSRKGADEVKRMLASRLAS